jgi:hypothetical protein
MKFNKLEVGQRFKKPGFSTEFMKTVGVKFTDSSNCILAKNAVALNGNLPGHFLYVHFNEDVILVK